MSLSRWQSIVHSFQKRYRKFHYIQGASREMDVFEINITSLIFGV